MHMRASVVQNRFYGVYCVTQMAFKSDVDQGLHIVNPAVTSTECMNNALFQTVTECNE